jgi:hypothetical protein
MKNIVKNPAQVNVQTTRVPKVHSMVRGNLVADFKRQDKLGLTNRVVNKEYGYKKAKQPKLEFISILDMDKILQPLETQRETSSKWAVDRQKARNGIDLVAFGVLSVALDPNDGNYHVWDGCGRMAIAELNGYNEPLPCMVYDMTKEEAAFYFAYNQSEGRRKLSNEAIFVNAFVGRDKATMNMAVILEQLGCYVAVNDSEFGIVNPGAREKGYPKILVRALQEGYELSGHDVSICRQARDMIVNLWELTENDQIVTELYWAITVLFTKIPETRSGKVHIALKEFLRGIAGMYTQAQSAKEWKGKELKGVSGNIGVAKQLAHALATNFRGSKFGNTATFKKIVDLERIIPTNTIAD